MVVTVHAPIVDEWAHYAGKDRYAALPGYIFERLTLSRTSSILAVSPATKSSLVHKYRIDGSKVSVVGNGVDFDRFSQPNHQERIANRILMVSRLEPRKNIPEALMALSRLPRGNYEAEVVGDGSQLKSLRSMAERMRLNLVFRGTVSGSDIPDVYGRAGIFLTTSRSEGFGLSLLEAMASGCSVVASDIPTHRELVSDGESGLIYGSTDELVASLNKLLNDEKLQTKLAIRGRAVARSLSWDNVSQKVFDAYRNALSRR